MAELVGDASTAEQTGIGGPTQEPAQTPGQSLGPAAGTQKQGDITHAPRTPEPHPHRPNPQNPGANRFTSQSWIL